MNALTQTKHILELCCNLPSPYKRSFGCLFQHSLPYGVNQLIAFISNNYFVYKTTN